VRRSFFFRMSLTRSFEPGLRLPNFWCLIWPSAGPDPLKGQGVEISKGLTMAILMRGHKTTRAAARDAIQAKLRSLGHDSKMTWKGDAATASIGLGIAAPCQGRRNRNSPTRNPYNTKDLTLVSFSLPANPTKRLFLFRLNQHGPARAHVFVNRRGFLCNAPR
jgi:hypothetical protein